MIMKGCVQWNPEQGSNSGLSWPALNPPELLSAEKTKQMEINRSSNTLVHQMMARNWKFSQELHKPLQLFKAEANSKR